ncbi:rhamnogalacturonate lyase B [Aspergillus avenaceus]|uniref:rhamnogalacturonan endolyase n=1 Tax=Aspergillus avenaceus TaxID=36643 RepID=A0A5N6U4Q4_ASPAV|nr:rhamnogalacturonate lyase B [Aspergillus avenaceus]
MRLTLAATWAAVASATLNVSQDNDTITLSNDRLTTVFAMAKGRVAELYLDGQDLLGPESGSSGVGPYLDCYCTPSGFYTAGSTNPRMEVVQGTDSTGTKWAGVILNDTYTPTGQEFQQYWFLRDGETGLHMFSRLAYYNETTPFLRNLQEFRTLLRPNTDLWTHLTSSDVQTAPLPSKQAIKEQVVVQDATWRFNNTPDDAYYTQFSEYFTKYTFSNAWRDNDVHGLYADGSTSNGTTYGAWLVMNTKDTYYGGPLHSDLTVDGIVYNYLVSNHHGEGTPNITHGFDRTFGPQYYYFNGGEDASLDDLRSDAASLATPDWNVDFYDSIADHVIGYAPSTHRGSVKGTIALPPDAERPIAVLTVDSAYFQDNSVAPTAHQYWAEIVDGGFAIDHVKADTYRLTVYADGVFGDFVRDGVKVSPGSVTTLSETWTAESAGTEIWRLGTPDKSSGEFRHGLAQDTTHPLHPPEYLIYWGAYDWTSDFPDGVNYTIGESDPRTDWNTVHWSVFGPTPDSAAVEYDTTHNWTINFPLEPAQLENSDKATLTIQLAGAKTAAGNTDVFNATEPYANLVLESYVNDHPPLSMFIAFNQSSSCIVRSAVSCYQVRQRLEFPADWLSVGMNVLTLHLPRDATDYESAVLPETVYVQYDALRLELA